jgi:hypothetical protein
VQLPLISVFVLQVWAQSARHLVVQNCTATSEGTGPQSAGVGGGVCEEVDEKDVPCMRENAFAVEIRWRTPIRWAFGMSWPVFTCVHSLCMCNQDIFRRLFYTRQLKISILARIAHCRALCPGNHLRSASLFWVITELQALSLLHCHHQCAAEIRLDCPLFRWPAHEHHLNTSHASLRALHAGSLLDGDPPYRGQAPIARWS